MIKTHLRGEALQCGKPVVPLHQGRERLLRTDRRARRGEVVAFRWFEITGYSIKRLVAALMDYQFAQNRRAGLCETHDT